MADNAALLACLGSSWFMAGLIWFVHVVHYPLFARVAPADFARYHGEHSRLTTYVVFLPMAVELISAAWLAARRPAWVAPWLAWAGLAAAGVSWLSTALVQVPLHAKLGAGFDAEAIRSLVAGNALRVASWSAHALIATAMVARRLVA